MLKHETVEVRKSFSCSPEKVFDAFADIKKRVIWAVPQGQKIEFEKSDFSIEGTDISICGEPEEMNFKTKSYYLDIKKNQRIVFTESIFYKDSLLSLSLNSMEFLSQKTGCELKLTIQIADLTGEEVKANYRQGWEAVFNNLVEFLNEK